MWCNICNERKRAQTSPYIIWEKEESKGQSSEIPEETVSAKCQPLAADFSWGSCRVRNKTVEGSDSGHISAAG
jgi:hypothetical protein